MLIKLLHMIASVVTVNDVGNSGKKQVQVAQDVGQSPLSVLFRHRKLEENRNSFPFWLTTLAGHSSCEKVSRTDCT